MSEPIRIAMWSRPRNISTAMMRAFENRSDTAVIDEPFYAVYLDRTGADHPMREECLVAQSTDPAAVIEALLGPTVGRAPIFYQKHMTHHMTAGVDTDWMTRCRNAFLIRAPQKVVASYAVKRADLSLEDIGFARQAELFDQVANLLGAAPPVLDADDVLTDPRRALMALCAALEIPFSEAMLAWPPGRRESDGVWAPVWYDAVERSTGFAAPSARAAPVLNDELQKIVETARPHYERLAAYRL
jgi:hypothetical protein